MMGPRLVDPLRIDGSRPLVHANLAASAVLSVLSCLHQPLAETTGYFPTGYLPGSLPIGALPTVATGGGSLRGKSAADATPTKANVATTANTSFVMMKFLSCP
jgi:hypothetical protein